MLARKRTTRGQRYKNSKRNNIHLRLLTGASILALITVIGIFVPFALATEGDGTLPGGSAAATAGMSGNTDEGINVSTPAIDTSADFAVDQANTAYIESSATEPAGNETGTSAATSSVATAAETSSDSNTGTQDIASSEATAETPTTETPLTAQDTSSGAASQNVSSTDDDGCIGCNAAGYDLDLICGAPFWESRADYDSRLLSITYQLINNGPGIASDLTMTSATATNGVTAAWVTYPTHWDEIAVGSWVYFTIKWLVPLNVTNFVTSIEVCPGCQEDDGSDDGNTDGDVDDGNKDDNTDDGEVDNNDDGDGDDGSTDTNLDSTDTDADSTGISTVNSIGNVAIPAAAAVEASSLSPAASQITSMPKTGYSLLPAFLFIASGFLTIAYGINASRRQARKNVRK